MSQEIPEELKFELPSNFIEQVYELSGNADKYKGVVLAYVSEDGSPIVFSKFDSQIVALGLHKALEKYLQNADDSETAFDFTDGEDED